MKKEEKIPLNYFVSYAHKNDALVADFLDKLEDHLGLSKKYQFTKWVDGDIIVGDDWDSQIQKGITDCDFGLLLLSASYFNRKYIKENELPHFVKEGLVLKPIVPVGLELFDLGGDLLGLEKMQIYRLQKAPGEELKFYSELRTNQRTNFINDLVNRMIAKFDKMTVIK